MPFKRAYKKKPSKKTFKKKLAPKKAAYRAPTTKNLVQVNAGLGFPKQMKMTHRYHDTITKVSTIGALVYHSYSCNGLFDPNVTGTGSQPLYFDQMTALYDHYTCIGAKVTLKVINIGAGFAGVFGCFINDDSTVVGNLNSLMENSNVSKNYMTYGNTDVKTITLNWSAKKNFPGNVLSNTSLQGTAAANPSEAAMFTIFFATLDASTQTLLFDVNIEYITVWNELKEVDES